MKQWVTDYDHILVLIPVVIAVLGAIGWVSGKFWAHVQDDGIRGHIGDLASRKKIIERVNAKAMSRDFDRLEGYSDGPAALTARMLYHGAPMGPA